MATTARPRSPPARDIVDNRVALSTPAVAEPRHPAADRHPDAVQPIRFGPRFVAGLIAALLVSVSPASARERTALASVKPILGLAGSGSPGPGSGSVSVASGSGSTSRARFGPPLASELIVVQAFAAPLTPYGQGHRGVDLRAVPGTSVYSAGDGIVRFAGPVAGRGVLVIAHALAISTEYEPVIALVHAGDTVRAGQPIALVADTAYDCPASCLHWGARRDGQYFDPMSLLAPLGPARLLPWRPTAQLWAEHCGSGPRMGGAVGITQSFDGDVGVDLGRGEAGVAQQFLHRSKIGAPIEQVGRSRVPQTVRAQIGCAGYSAQALVHDLADGSLVDASPPGSEQQRGPAPRDQQRGPPKGQPVL